MKVLLVTIATLLHLFGLGDCFHLKKILGTCSRQTHIIVFEGKEDGDKGGSSGRKRRKKRSADYPSFSYDGSTSYATRRTPQKVSFTMQCTDGTTYTNTTATVSGLSEFVQMTSQSQNPFETDLLKNGVQAEKSRLLENRAYAKKEPFLNPNLYSPPILKDLSPPPTKPSDTYWISTAARLSSFIGPYLIFPYLVMFLDHFVTMPPEKLAEITSKFAPGVSILYGTFVSLTLSILYNRQQKIQETVSTESSLISMITRNLLALFREDTDSAIEAGQCCADQIRILATGSRGGELMLLMYSDPYARMLELVESREERLTREQGDLGGQGILIANCRDVVKDLFKIRATRLSLEALALPSTHFFILTCLTSLILLGYTINTLPTLGAETVTPSNESSLLFGLLCSTYLIFYNFAQDLDDAFGGIYQVRRSSTASHLLQTKWLIVNHPLLRGEVDFEEAKEDLTGDVLIHTPGLGDLYFGKDEIYL